MKAFVKPITWLTGIEHGYGNGYIVLPKGHKYHGLNYDNIPVDVHCGLTFSEPANELIGSDQWLELDESDEDGWVIGFDTAHFGDDLSRWPDEKSVMKEVRFLKSQLL